MMMMDLQWIEELGDYKRAANENIRKCLKISYGLGEIGKEGNYSVASLLEGEDFICLSEDQKAEVFSHIHWCWSPEQDRSYSLYKTCLHKVADLDKPTYIKQMLPCMPLHKFQSYNLRRADLTGIESEEWMRDMLLKHKVRWNPDSNAGVVKSFSQEASDRVADAKLQSNEKVTDEKVTDEKVTDAKETDEKETAEKVTHEDIIQKLRNLAFTMLAAELFYICCRCKAIQCCEFLLDIAPNLVEIHAGEDPTVALTTALMYDSSEVIDLLIERGAPIRNIGKAAHQVFLNSDSKRSFLIIRNVLQNRNHRDKVNLYQDHDGNTLLHLLIEPLVQRNSSRDRTDKATKHKITHYLFSCIQAMLDHGADPRKMNNNNETVLDFLIQKYIQYGGFRSSELTEIFLRNLELILPSWGLALPLSFPRKHKSVEDRVVMLCKIAELLLNDEHSLTFAIRAMQNYKVFSECKPTACQVCLPAVSLFYKAMCMGIDMYRIPGKPLLLPETISFGRCKDYISYSLCVSSSQGYVVQRNALLKCCDWALLELLVHSRNDAFSQIDIAEGHEVVLNRAKLLGQVLGNLTWDWSRSKFGFFCDQINGILSMLSMYSPSIFQMVLPRFLTDGTIDANDNKEVESMLKTIAQNHTKFGLLRPLKLVCRLTIRANVAFKDVEKLTLPRVLKQYLCIGDIPKSHVIHQIIDEIDGAKQDNTVDNQ